MSVVDTNTLAYHMARPLVRHVKAAAVMLDHIAPRAVEESKKGISVDPGTAAFVFYYLNHAWHLTRSRLDPHEPLGSYEWFVTEYFDQVTPLAMYFFYYLLLICSRESRHTQWTNTIRTNLQSKYGPEITAFYEKVNGDSASTVYNALKNNPPKVPLSRYTESLVYIFYHGSYGSAWGGPAWGAVAACLHNMVVGPSSPEIMLDTGFTLAHNNGPIFNKSIFFGNYTSEFIPLLDIQRAGMVPQLANDMVNGVVYLPSIKSQWIKYNHDKMVKLFGGPYSGHVDWYKVGQLGAVSPLTKYQAAQNKAPWNNKDGDGSVQLITILPGVSVKKVKRPKPQKGWKAA